MNARFTLLVLATVVLGACAKFKANDERGSYGAIYEKGQATAVLVRAQDWCMEQNQPNGNFTTMFFAENGLGHMADFNRTTGKLEKQTGIMWGIEGDYLMINDAVGKPLTGYFMRFQGTLGAEKVILLNQQKAFAGSMKVCEI